MGKINVLDKNVAELIAAGEVIERPASIVKELLENSIDAGASAVTVEIRRGGVSYIRVTDNGSGILPEDIPLAFLRHATSKIKLSDDLNFISTLGFRGEALASVAAVSRMELTSKTRDAQLGTSIFLEGGEQRSLSEAGCPDGTTILVKDLFYNVPARLKFLRRDQSEASTVGGLVEKLAISHPEVSVKFISDHKVRLHTPGDGQLLSAIHAVFGGEFSSALLAVDYRCDGVSVKGYTSSSRASRSNRSMQHFFVNARYIRSKVCSSAVEEGYKNSIMVGKYPFCVLDVSLPYESVDVNVHPSKTEVRFVEERKVFDAVYFAVKSALSKDDILKNARAEVTRAQSIPNLLSQFQSEEAEQTRLSPKAVTEGAIAEEKPSAVQAEVVIPEKKVSEIATAPLPRTTAQSVISVRDSALEPDFTQNPVTERKTETARSTKQKRAEELEDFQFIRPEMLTRNQAIKPEAPTEKVEESPIPPRDDHQAEIQSVPSETPSASVDFAVRVLGEAFGTYVVFEAEDTLYLLDKHAAHERILFERLKRSVTTEERQLLLKPVVVTVSPEENRVLLDHQELLTRMGFQFEEFGNHSLVIREVPLLLAEYDIAEIFLDTAEKLLANKRDVTSDIFENLLHSIACRSAIKAHDDSSMEELTALLRQVCADGEIRHCPHGRPVAIAMPRTEIERKFGRV